MNSGSRSVWWSGNHNWRRRRALAMTMRRGRALANSNSDSECRTRARATASLRRGALAMTTRRGTPAKSDSDFARRRRARRCFNRGSGSRWWSGRRSADHNWRGRRRALLNIATGSARALITHTFHLHQFGAKISSEIRVDRRGRNVEDADQGKDHNHDTKRTHFH